MIEMCRVEGGLRLSARTESMDITTKNATRIMKAREVLKLKPSPSSSPSYRYGASHASRPSWPQPRP